MSSSSYSASGAVSSFSRRAGYAPSPDRIIAHAIDELYPKEVWYFLGSFIGFVALLQLFSLLYAKTRSVGKTHSEEGAPPASHGISLKRIPLVVLNAFRVVAFRSTITIGQYSLNLAEVALTAIYIVALFTWQFINTTTLKGQRLNSEYWAVRAGALIVSQLPLITALGTKNNIIGLLTGVSFEKLNYLHRMTARVILVLAWVHGGAIIMPGISSEELAMPWLRLGLLAATSLSILCLVSIRPIRGKAYEFFFYAHFVLVAIFLIAAYYHAQFAYFQKFVWSSLVIWAADRVIRVIRLVVFNNSFFSAKTETRTLDAQTELLSEHLVRLTLHRPPHFHWSPGQMAYLIMPGVSALPIEAHPFTISSLDSSRMESTKSGSASSSEKTLTERGSYWKELVFLINVRGGATKHLGRVAAKKGTMKVFVDGPYGASQDLSRFETVALIAGGSGVTYTLPFLLDTIERSRLGKNNCRKLTFIWAIRDADHIRWISDTVFEALQRAPETLDISIRIYVTGSSPDNTTWDDDSVHDVTPESSAEKIKGPPSLLGLPSVVVAEGRPDISSILREAAQATSGSMSVSVCGSSGITHAVRSALRFPLSEPGNILRGGASISLHVEEFGYA